MKMKLCTCCRRVVEMSMCRFGHGACADCGHVYSPDEWAALPVDVERYTIYPDGSLEFKLADGTIKWTPDQ